MKEMFEEMFRYHHHFNQKLIEEFQKHRDKLPERSFPLFCHMLNAHHVWNARILGASEQFKVQQLHSLDQCPEIDSVNHHTTMNLLGSVDLGFMIEYRTSRGEPFTNSAKDILFHVVNHTTHHRGQIISDFRQAGIQPLVTDYIFYKRV